MTTALLLIAVFVLVLLNGFFVAAEFALVAARRPLLERAAKRGSRPAAAALAGVRELSLMLAGAQFGITMCTLGLGLVTEPAFERLLAPPLHDVGLPESVSHAVAIAITLALVTFAHMVLGEMTPKSWAITHPERSALILALPFRAFTYASRPVLALLNEVTNGLLRALRVSPRDTLDTHTDPERLDHLLGESRRLGLIDRHDHALLGRAMAVREATVEKLIVPAERVTSVPEDASPADVRRAAHASGHARLLVRSADGAVSGIVHVRDALTATGDGARAVDLAYPVPEVPATTSVLDATSRLRRARAQLAVVNDSGGAFRGIVSLDDLLGQLLVADPH